MSALTSPQKPSNALRWPEKTVSVVSIAESQEMSGIVSGVGQAAVKKPRAKRIEDSKYPYRMDFGITPELNSAVKRMLRGPFKQSQIGQIILHDYFMRNDPIYAKFITEGGGTNGAP